MSRIELLSQVTKIQETLSSNNSLNHTITMDANQLTTEDLDILQGVTNTFQEVLLANQPNRNNREYTIDAFIHGLIGLDELRRSQDVSVQTTPWVQYGEEEETNTVYHPLSSEGRQITANSVRRTFNGRVIGTLDSIDYTISRDRDR